MLCKIVTDETAPPNVIEATLRAVTFYLDVSADCIRRVVSVDGALAAMCQRLEVATVDEHTTLDVAIQCIKVFFHACWGSRQVLELVCTRESGAVLAAGGLRCCLTFLSLKASEHVFKDVIKSAMVIVSKCCRCPRHGPCLTTSRIEPDDAFMSACIAQLAVLMHHSERIIAVGSLRSFAQLADKFHRKHIDPQPLVTPTLVAELLAILVAAATAEAAPPDDGSPAPVVVDILSSLW